MAMRANSRWIGALLIAAALGACSGVGASLKKERDAAIVTAGEQCKSALGTADLDPIRHKVELYRESPDAGVPFEIASNDAHPTDAELPVIAKWATLRDECIRLTLQASKPLADAGTLQSAFMRQRQFLYGQAGQRISDLIVALHQKKLTYAEFAHKRYEINRAVWLVATAAGDIAVALPTPIKKGIDLDPSHSPILF